MLALAWPGRESFAVLEPAIPPDEVRLPRSILPGLAPAGDPRRPVEVARLPWRALGRVQTAAGGGRRGTGLWCTGVLIGPRTVLTAAHCLVSAQTRRFLQPGSVGFVLAYERGAYAGHARASAFAVAPGFDPATGGPPGSDWALLTLQAPLGAVTGPDRVLGLARDLPEAGTPVALGAYQQDRREMLLADPDCRILGLSHDGADPVLLRHDCAATRGADGAPLLARAGPDGEWVVVGLAVRMALRRLGEGGAAGVLGGTAVPAAAIDPAAAVPPGRQ